MDAMGARISLEYFVGGTGFGVNVEKSLKRPFLSVLILF